MSRDDGLREGEVGVGMPPPDAARLRFIGRIRTPWTVRRDGPHQGSEDKPVCRPQPRCTRLPRQRSQSYKDKDFHRFEGTTLS
ncbi:hypothetical protein STAQ_13440 [Allostella sp. ATCC 35155]|nr:hypothetical protein STAQ_13440 [Stella sp. ATCC 35155]